MCGGYTIAKDVESIKERFQVEVGGLSEHIAEQLDYLRKDSPQLSLTEEVVDFAKQGGLTRSLVPRYNARPAQMLPIITSEKPGELQFAYWGMHPSWLEKAGIKHDLINTRAESLGKPAFVGNLRHHRCLVIADGFLEWADFDGKYPYRFTLPENTLFSMAGIYHYDEDEIPRFSIITTRANQEVTKYHDRMPVILAQDEELQWLKTDCKDSFYQSLAKPFRAEKLAATKLSRRINSSTEDDQSLLDPL